MESFSTYRLPASRKVAFWNEITSDTFAALEIKPRDPVRFDGTLTRERVGPLTLMGVRSTSVRVAHTRAHIARTPSPSYLLLAPLSGEFALELEHAPCVTVRTGEFCLIDHARPYTLAHGDDVRTLCVDVPRASFEERVSHVAPLVGRVVQPDNATARMLGVVLQGLGLELGAVTNFSPAFGHTLLDLIAATYSPLVEPALGRGGKAFRAYIDSRLAEPELKPADVAAHFHVSERYMRAVLRKDGDSFGAYLLHQRLVRSAAMLHDPDWSESTITEIAFRAGFSNATHFGQAFKQLFGVTPRDYRASAGKATAR
jgi:AraC family transcriptional regulator, positive regulator of tynA and feaB